MCLLRHGQYLIVAQLHIAKADKDAIDHSAVPNPCIGKRAKPDLIKIRLHIQQQPASGYKIHLQNMVGQCCDRCEIPSVQVCALLSAKIKSTVQKLYSGFYGITINQRLGLLSEQLARINDF